jgi:hypothetical protein
MTEARKALDEPAMIAEMDSQAAAAARRLIDRLERRCTAKIAEVGHRSGPENTRQRMPLQAPTFFAHG